VGGNGQPPASALSRLMLDTSLAVFHDRTRGSERPVQALRRCDVRQPCGCLQYAVPLLRFQYGPSNSGKMQRSLHHYLQTGSWSGDRQTRLREGKAQRLVERHPGKHYGNASVIGVGILTFTLKYKLAQGDWVPVYVEHESGKLWTLRSHCLPSSEINRRASATAPYMKGPGRWDHIQASHGGECTHGLREVEHKAGMAARQLETTTASCSPGCLRRPWRWGHQQLLPVPVTRGPVSPLSSSESARTRTAGFLGLE